MTSRRKESVITHTSLRCKDKHYFLNFQAFFVKIGTFSELFLIKTGLFGKFFLSLPARNSKTFIQMKRLLLTIVILSLFSCSNQKSKMQIGEYVYQDTQGIIHTNNGCTAVSKIKGGGQPVKLLETASLTEDHLNKICSQCVNKEQIDGIRMMFEAKRAIKETEEEEMEEEYNNHSLGFKIRQWLYVKLGGKLDNTNSWRNFNDRLENEDQRMIIYNTAKRNLIDLPEYSKFSEEIDKYREEEAIQMFSVDTVVVE